jgi:hypothetical protein
MGEQTSVTASVDQLLLGGPTGANEGTILAFAITAKPGASGTYQLAVAQAGLFLADQGGQRGGVPNGILVAGTGQPDYVQSNVIFLPVYVNYTSGFQIQGMAYGMCSDILYYRFMVVTNSTQ